MVEKTGRRPVWLLPLAAYFLALGGLTLAQLRAPTYLVSQLDLGLGVVSLLLGLVLGQGVVQGRHPVSLHSPLLTYRCDK